MTAPVAFGDIVTALAEHLETLLPTYGIAVPVVASVPATRPKRFVRVANPGGSQGNIVTDRPRIVCECWDVTGAGASDLARVVRALVSAAAPGRVGGIWVDRVVDLGRAYSEDPGTKLPRYLVSAELHVRGEELT